MLIEDTKVLKASTKWGNESLSRVIFKTFKLNQLDTGDFPIDVCSSLKINDSIEKQPDSWSVLELFKDLDSLWK